MTKLELTIVIIYAAMLVAIPVGTVAAAISHWQAVQSDASGILGGAIALGVGIPLVALGCLWRDLYGEE